MKIPCMTHPCKACPFRKDTLKGWLGEKRMTEILDTDTFPCHKTKGDRKQCAGHMLLKGDDNAFVRVAKAHELDLGLTGRELIFDNEQDCLNHHKQ